VATSQGNGIGDGFNGQANDDDDDVRHNQFISTKNNNTIKKTRV